MIRMIVVTFCVLALASLGLAGGEKQSSSQQTKKTTTASKPAPPPYPAELECQYQALKNGQRFAWQAPKAIPFSPCGPFTPNVSDGFGFGPYVNGFDFVPGGRLEPITPGMLAIGLYYAGLPPSFEHLPGPHLAFH